jgi:hypothetical protein
MTITKGNEKDSGVDPFVQCITLPSACHMFTDVIVIRTKKDWNIFCLLSH